MTGEDCTNPTMQLKKWYVDMIRCYRKEHAKLPEEKQKQILMKCDYSPPCQIEVFWLGSPNWQLAITTHFEDRGDLEIEVNGPYASNVFLDETEKILNQPRWHKPIPKNSENPNPNHPSRHVEHVAQLLHGFVEAAKNAAFTDYEPAGIYFRRVDSGNESIEVFYGDKRFVDYEKSVKDLVAGITDQSEPGKKPRPMPKRQAELPKYGKGFGTCFLPPIIIGKLPGLTISDRLHGTTSRHMHMSDRKSFVQLFGETPVMMANNGHVVACTSDRERAIRILNTIMATFEMKGLEARAVWEHDLSKIEYNTETLDIASLSYDPDMIRNKPLAGYPNEIAPERGVREIQEEPIRNMIEAASKIFEDPNMAEMAVNFGYMLAHLKDNEFPGAFIAGWKIVEQHIAQKWKGSIGSKQAGSAERFKTTHHSR